MKRVQAERKVRGLSIRAAARAGNIANTTWGNWEESGGVPTPKMRTAVATAFGWPGDWPENPPAETTVSPLGDALDRTAAQLRREIEAVDARVRGFEATFQTQLASMVVQLEALADRLDARES